MGASGFPAAAGSAERGLEALRARIAADDRRDEAGAVLPLLADAQMAAPALRATHDVARRLAEGVRAERRKATLPSLEEAEPP